MWYPTFPLLVFLLTDNSASLNCWHEVHSEGRVAFIIDTFKPSLKPERLIVTESSAYFHKPKSKYLHYYILTFFHISAIALSFT